MAENKGDFIMHVRINIGEYLNNLVAREYRLQVIEKQVSKLKNAPDIPIEHTMGIYFQIVASYLYNIASRAIELNDEKLLEYCEGLGLITKKGE